MNFLVCLFHAYCRKDYLSGHISDWTCGINMNNLLHFPDGGTALHTYADSLGTDYWINVVTSKSLVFKLKACKEISIIIAQYKGVFTYNAYEIRLGANDGTVDIIKDTPYTGETVATNDNPVLDCDVSQWFWVSWNNGIMFGTGPLPDANVKISWAIPYFHPIENIGIRSFTDDGVWEFFSSQGKRQ